jgi:exopolysaccharide biosynthesis WecB/TagA/CpsF family protein
MSALDDTRTPALSVSPSPGVDRPARVSRRGAAALFRLARPSAANADESAFPFGVASEEPSMAITLFGLPVLAASATEAIDEIRVRARVSRLRLAYVNAHTLNLAHRNSALREALASCDLLLNDGAGVALAARLRGRRFPENLQGTDFNLRLLALADELRWPVFLLGARPGVARRAALELKATLPSLRIVGTRHGFHDDAAADVAVIHRSGARMLMVAMGNPRQELWLSQHFESLAHVHIGVGVGAFLDFQARVTPRAPGFMIEHGLEWVYRLRCEPRRLAGRYLLGNPSFLARALRDAARRPAGTERAKR